MKQYWIFFIFLLYLPGYAQQTTFSKVFSNIPLNPENAAIIKEMTDGYLVLSSSDCNDNSDHSCCVLSKLNTSGEVLWYKQYSFHQGSSSLVLLDNRIYVSGHTEGLDQQFVLYCLDSEGDIIWNKEYGSPDKNETFPRLAYANGKWILCGTLLREIDGQPSPLLYFVVTDMEGTPIVEYYYGNQNESTVPHEIQHDLWGNLLISYIYCPNSCFLDLKAGVLRMDETAFIEELIDLPFSFQPHRCIAAQIDSSTLAVKWHINSSLPNHDLTPPALFFTDLTGNIQDTIIFENQSLKEVDNMETILGHGLVGCGSNYINYLTQSSPKLGGWIFRIDQNREILWDRIYLDSTFQGRSFGLNQIIPSSDGGYIAVGTINSYLTGVWESNNWVLKLDSLGCLEPGCGDLNYVTETQEAEFLKGKGIRVYPNPADAYVSVEFPEGFSLGEQISLQLFSNSGSLLTQKRITVPVARLETKGFPPGLYHVLIWKGNELLGNKKVIVQH